MTVSLTSLGILADLNLTSEQMAGVLRVLAVELAPLEKRRQKDRERKIHGKGDGKSTDDPQNVRGNSVEPLLSRVEDKLLTTFSNEKKTIPPINPPIPSKPTGLSEHPTFGDFWSIYPLRDGDRDRRGAVKAFNAAVKRAEVGEIIAGAQRYAAYLVSKGKAGTEFVCQARTWLNGDRWNEDYGISGTGNSSEQQAEYKRVLGWQ